MRYRGFRTTVVCGAALCALLGWALWANWDRILFFRSFESLGKNVQGYHEYRHLQTGIVFVRVPGGTSTMPHGPLSVEPFLIGKYEVTQRVWLDVMGSNPSEFRQGGPREGHLPEFLLLDGRWLDLPVEGVSWEDVQSFEVATGLTLPTEAQWEQASQGGRSVKLSETTEALDEVGWYYGNCFSRTHPVGLTQPNQFGLHDMYGNIAEWCEDGYSDLSFRVPEHWRAVRGGAWIWRAGEMSRESCRVDRGAGHVGFRPAWTRGVPDS